MSEGEEKITKISEREIIEILKTYFNV